MQTTIAIYPGTFDPVTLGHLNIIERAAKMVGSLIIAVAKDTGKNPIFTQEERTQLVSFDIKHLSNVRVIPFAGLLVDFLKKQNASFIIRGLRTVSDFESESAMSIINKKLHGSVETIFLPAEDTTKFISSTIVRQIAQIGGDVSQFVTKNVADKLKEKFS